MSGKIAASRPLVVYVSEIAPSDTAASRVVTFRHLRALERCGFDICAVIPEGLDETGIPSNWHIIRLPMRKAYYPPYRPYWPLRGIRWALLDRIVLPLLGKRPVACVLGLLMGEYLAGYASWLSQKLHRPLFYFYHDRGEHLHAGNNPRRAKRIRHQNLKLLTAANTKKVWTVSPTLVYDEPVISEKFKVVYPLPERLHLDRSPSWQTCWQQRQELVHIGTIYRETVDSFRMILGRLRLRRGRLHIYSHFADTAELLLNEFPDVVRYGGFVPDSDELLRTVAATGSAFLTVYPDKIEQMAWSRECFPSKFVQLVQTRLPGIVFAPHETAIGQWCSDTQWLLHYSQTNETTIDAALDAVSHESKWRQAAYQSNKAASTEFSPDVLERLVNEDVLTFGQ